MERGRSTSTCATPSSGVGSTVRVYVPATARVHVRRLYKDSPIAGHPGMKKTLRVIGRKYTWQGMETDVREYVSTCIKCQENSPPSNKPPGLLHPLPIPDGPRQSISIGSSPDYPRRVCKRMTLFALWLTGFRRRVVSCLCIMPLRRSSLQSCP